MLKNKRLFFLQYYIYSITFILCNMNTNLYQHINDLLMETDMFSFFNKKKICIVYYNIKV